METRYDHQQAELAAQKKWEQEKTYAYNPASGPTYSVDTPPPTVSGSLHIGHIFSYTQTDIIARFKRMQGSAVFYPFGFDDNGLPTERFVEQKRDIKAHELTRSEFIRVCLEETHAVEQEFKVLWQRMGLSVDWNAWYSTISESSRKISQESFILLYKKGFIYRKYEPALYCTHCRTSVAQAELDDMDHPAFFNDIIFKAQDGSQLVIGTTRPELLSSCVAMFYHPSDSRFTHLHGKKAIVPIFGNEVPILADELVDPEKGTGLVMCCTFGDKTDVHWWKQHSLPYKQSIGNDGKWVADTGPLEGLRAKAAREKILELLKEQGLVLDQKPIIHAVNVHERCKKEIEYVALSQWFVKILEYKKEFLAQAEKITWSPSFMKSRFSNWVENLSWDWCISRQRFYGIPFPVWHCMDCSEILLAPLHTLPVDPQETLYPSGSCAQCGSRNIGPDTDVMDTWNTSSLTPYLAYNLIAPRKESVFADSVKRFLPMSMRPQAHDIIRTWAFYTIVKAWMHNNELPWSDIVISGHVLADKGGKISKSKGGATLTPEALLAHYPADAIRFWTASGGLGHDVAFSDNQLKIGLKLITKLWNAFRFIGMQLPDYTPSPVAPENFGIINEWIVSQASHTFTLYKKAFDAHEFSHALTSIEQFFWHDFCDNYLELIKNQLFNPDQYSQEDVAATRWTLYHVGLRILQLYAPFLPYITEAIYGSMYQKQVGIPSLHLTKFESVQMVWDFGASVAAMQTILNLIVQVRKLKSEHQLSLKTELSTLTIYADEPKLVLLREQEQLIKGIAHAHTVEYSTKAENSSLTQADTAWIAAVTLI
ncbi:MAG: valine--tRNA ligase [Candidatus Babeliales bacterium]